MKSFSQFLQESYLSEEPAGRERSPREQEVWDEINKKEAEKAKIMAQRKPTGAAARPDLQFKKSTVSNPTKKLPTSKQLWAQFPAKPKKQYGLPKEGPSSRLPGRTLAPAGGTSPRPALPAAGQTQRGSALARRPTSTPTNSTTKPSTSLSKPQTSVKVDDVTNPRWASADLKRRKAAAGTGPSGKAIITPPPSSSSTYRNSGAGVRDTFRAQSTQPQQQTSKRSNPNIPSRNPGESREAYAQRRMQATQQRMSGRTPSSSAIVPTSRTSSSAIVPAGKPPTGTKPSTWSKIGKWGGRALTALDAASNIATEMEKGSGLVRSFTKGAVVTAGGLAGGTLGAIGGGGLGSAALGAAGSIGGSQAAGKAFDTIAGANARERKAMATANRQRQAGTAVKGIGGKTTFSQAKPGGPAFMSTGVGNQRKTVQLSKTGVVQRGGQSVAGHLAFKDGKAVYKAGPSAQTLAKTSSNPLERIGRSLFAGAYKKHDTMKAQQALQRASQSDALRNKKLGVKMKPGG